MTELNNKMGCSKIPQSIEVIIEETESGVSVKSINNLDKSTCNGYKTVVLEFDNIFVNRTRAAIDPSVIFSLNLSRSNLNYFPDGFAGLELKWLDLSYNNLENVPDCILKGLRSLEILDLSHNSLKSFDEPKCVKNLRVLKINNNKLINIPEWILQVKAFNLEELYFSYNEVTSLKQSRFLKSPSYELNKLELKNCLIRDEDLKFLKHIRTLHVLDLSNKGEKSRNCFASSDSFCTLIDKPMWDDRLKILVLNDLQISFVPEEITQLVVLEELYLAKNDLMWLPDSVSAMANLRVLDLSHNQLVGFPDAICSLINLEVLKASNNCISRIFDLTLTKLKLLDLYENYLDTDCDIKIDCISQIDLEQNYFDTAGCNEGYASKKNTLRENVEEGRMDGPKEQKYDEKDPSSTDEESDSEYSSGSAHDEPFRDETIEDNWSLEYQTEPCDNGCTLSDNEWTGHEPVPFVRKKSKRKLVSHPSWVFEDVET